MTTAKTPAVHGPGDADDQRHRIALERARDGEHGVPLLEAVSAADLRLDPADLPQFA